MCMLFAQDLKGADIGKTYKRQRILSQRLKEATTPWSVALHIKGIRLVNALLGGCPQKIVAVGFWWPTHTMNHVLP